MFPGLLQGVRKQYSTCRNYTVDYLFVSQFKVRVRITLDTSFDKINSFRNLGGFPEIHFDRNLGGIGVSFHFAKFTTFTLAV